MTDAEMSDTLYSIYIAERIRNAEMDGLDTVEISIGHLRVIMNTLHERGRVLEPIAEQAKNVPRSAADDELIRVSIAAGDLREALEYRRMPGFDANFRWDSIPDL